MGLESVRPVHYIRSESNPLMANIAEANYVDDLNKEVFYNYFFLIEPEDFPEELKLKNDDDSRLFDDTYLFRVAEKIKETLGIPSSLILTDETKNTLRIILKLMINPDKCNQAKQFVLAHEISHLFYKHHLKFENEAQKGKWKRSITAAVIGTISLLVIKQIIASKLLLIGSSLVVYTIGVFVFDRLNRLAISRRHEKEADLKAAETVGSQGGIYLNETTRKHFLSFSKDPNFSSIKKFFIPFIFNNKGDFRFSLLLTHPNPRERAEAITNILECSK